MTAPPATPTPPVITRFAPSPTGRLHIGGARTALFNWAYAKGRGGHFMLRIEDTDQARSSSDAVEQILRSLAWLGLDWDEGPQLTHDGRTLGGDPRSVGPFFQAQRLGGYKTAAEFLLENDLAYHAFETPEELDRVRAGAISAKQTYRYNRAALEIPADERRRRAEAGEPHVLRFRSPDEPVTVKDDVLGEVTVRPGEIDDFIIVKRDGFPTYHFACVVDDEAMGVTHVVRGQEHLANTPRHVQLQQALGYKTPAYAHLPLIFNPDGSKMSKRDKDKAARQSCKARDLHRSPIDALPQEVFEAWLKDKKRQLSTQQLTELAGKLAIPLPEIDTDDFDASGYLPETLCNYLSLLGWSPGGDLEKFDLAFLKEKFDLPRIGKTSARFDRAKLLAFNTDAFAEMPDEAFTERFRAWCAVFAPEITIALDSTRFTLLAAGLRPRSKTFADAAASARFALLPDDGFEYDDKAVEKNLLKNDGEGVGVLIEFRRAAAELADFSPGAVHSMVQWFAEQHGLKLGKVAQPLRVALTGSTVSPPIDVTLAALGKVSVVARIDRALERFGAAASP